jgi:GxxExxY protein
MPGEGISITQHSIPTASAGTVVYKGVHLECGYRLDFLVGDSVVVEIKSVDGMPPIYESQLVTYLSLGGRTVGLLINFNVLLLKDGIRRRVLNFQD